jgi:uncharacterized protein DUF4190/predicted membrane protein DUF2232
VTSSPTDPYGQWDSSTATPPPKAKNGMGVAALVFGILAILTCWFPIVGLVLGLLALIFGIVGRGRARRGLAGNGGMALTGIVLGVLSIIVNIIATLVLGVGALAFFQSGGGNSLQQAQQCLSQAQNAGSPAAVQQAISQCKQQFQQQLPDIGGTG